jgi:hypothetical protein
MTIPHKQAMKIPWLLNGAQYKDGGTIIDLMVQTNKVNRSVKMVLVFPTPNGEWILSGIIFMGSSYTLGTVYTDRVDNITLVLKKGDELYTIKFHLDDNDAIDLIRKNFIKYIERFSGASGVRFRL